MYFDTHAHYDSGAFNADRFDILGSMPDAKVGLIVNPGCDLESSKTAIGLAERFNFVYAAVGYHPEDCQSVPDSDEIRELDRIAELMKHNKAVAVGEIGLDYHYDGTMKEKQQRFFDASMGVGTAVIGLASVIIGTALFGQVSLFNFSLSVILGSILYKGCVAAAIRLGLQSSDLKLITAVLFLLILVISMRIEKYQGRVKRKERA